MSNFMQNYCAYHPNQPLTNFCTCPQCLLPVCPSCIKIHSEQHQLKNTAPSFQKLNDMFGQVSTSCSNIISSLEKLRQELLQVQKVKKQNESLIRQKIKAYRSKLIREFQRALFDLEYTIIKKFEDEDEKFIQQIQEVDKNIDRLYQNIQQQQNDLHSTDGLRTVIFHLSKNIEIESLQFVNSMDKKIKDMLKKNLYLEIQQHKIDEVKNSVLSFLKLDIIQWGTQIRQQKRFSFNQNNANQNNIQFEIQKTKRSPKNNYYRQSISQQQGLSFIKKGDNYK